MLTSRGVTARQLTILYVAALSSVALLSIAGQALVQLAIESQTSDARIINLAGRQRMLSQRLSKAALEHQLATSFERKVELHDELESTRDEWIRAHQGLLHGDESLGLRATTSEHVRTEFETLTPIQERMNASVEALLAISESESWNEALAALLSDEDSYLETMDAIVFTLEQEASSRVQTLRRIEFALLFLTLVVLTIEGLFVFRPAVRSLQHSMNKLNMSRAREANAAKELAAIFHNVPALVWYQDETGKIVRANERAQRIVDEFSTLDKVSRHLSANATSDQTRVRFNSDGDSPIHLDVKREPFPRCSGDEHGFIFLAEDVTERELLENQLLQIKVDEQRRIGHDLHDGVGQIMTGVLYLSSRLFKKLERREAPEAASAGEIVDHVKESISQVRALSRGLCPLDENEGGLVSAIRELSEQTAKLSGIGCTLDCNCSDLSIQSPADEQLYRIAQEAVSNAVRHSDAKSIVISLKQTHSSISVSIKDNGIGISVPLQGHGSSGMGIRIMRRRAELLGANLSIESDRGTRVICEIPNTANTKRERATAGKTYADG